jgi:oligopeptide transport system substrate-binding protein
MGIGTPEYMSPEQGLGRQVDGRTDIYSLGTVLYELITGQKPYKANTPMEIVLKQSTIPLKKPSSVVPGITEFTDDILLKAMATEPEDRFRDMKEFHEVLESVAQKGKTAVDVHSTQKPINPPKINEERTPPKITEKKVEKETDYFVTEVTPLPAEKLKIKTKKVEPPPLTVKKPARLGWVFTGFGAMIILVIFGVSLLFPKSGFSQAIGLGGLFGGGEKTPTYSIATSTRIAFFVDTPIPTPSPTHAPFIVPTEMLRVNLGSPPGTLDPQKASWVNEVAHLQLIYEGLTRLNGNLETVPGAAEKWEYSADGTEITFTLRKNLKYSDGSLLNARRFEYSLLRDIDPNMKGNTTFLIDIIMGAAEYRNAEPANLSAEQLDSLKAGVQIHAYDTNGAPCENYEQEDCLILKLRTIKPSPSLATLLSLYFAYPAKEELITQGGESWWIDPANQIGNGPYIIDTYEDQTLAHFRVNPNYWGDYAKVNVEYYYWTNASQAFTAYKNDQVDIIRLSAEDLIAAKADPVTSKEILIYPGYCTFALMMNQTKEPFNDPKVREAFAYGFDREGYVNDVLQGLGSPTLTWIPKGFPGYDASENRWAFDPEKARQAMMESSYGSPEKLPKITFTFPDTAQDRNRYEKLVAEYQRSFNLQISLNPVDRGAFAEMITKPDTAPQLFVTGWCSDYPAPRDWLSFYWKTGMYAARIGYSNAKVDNLLNEADAEINPIMSLQLYQEAQRMIVEDIPAVFMYNSVNAFLVKPYVRNLTLSPMDSSWAGIMAVNEISIER